MGNNKSSVSTDYEKQVNNNDSGGEGTELVNKKGIVFFYSVFWFVDLFDIKKIGRLENTRLCSL